MAKSYVKEPLKGQVGKATGLGHLTTSSMYGTCSGNGISRALPLLPRRERERRQLLGQPATCTTPALPRPSGLALAGASDSWEPPPMLALLGPGAGGGAEPGHPPFESRGSGCLPAGRQRSGPRGGASGSSLFHFLRYFERTPFQDPQTCGHCTCLLNETQVKSAGKKKKKRKELEESRYLWKSLFCLWRREGNIFFNLFI